MSDIVVYDYSQVPLLLRIGKESGMKEVTIKLPVGESIKNISKLELYGFIVYSSITIETKYTEVTFRC
jgi:hypothetical protein